MTWARLAAGLSLLLFPASSPAQSRTAVPQLDHLVIVTRDLDSASAVFAVRGFRLKPGHVHSDNLLNRHIKFRDGTELELMTLAGPPLDANARDYAEALADRAGPLYVALRVESLGPILRAAQRLGLPVQHTASGSWEFLSFPGPSDASAVFFLSGGEMPRDPDSLVTHPNGGDGLEEVWVEAGPRLEALIEGLGAARGQPVSLPDGRQGRRWQLGRGSLVICASDWTEARPRPFGVTIRGSEPLAAPQAVRLPDGLWLMVRPASLTPN